ncbi:MAG: Xaa-Pro peptidase family protein [Pseudomonadota bacterium]
MMAAPRRGFETAEYAARTARALAAMEAHAEEPLAGIVITSPPTIRYFTGFETTFWESPTRPFFVILVPGRTAPIAVVPDLGEVGMRQAFTSEVRTWASPEIGDGASPKFGDGASPEIGDGASQTGSAGVHEGLEALWAAICETMTSLGTRSGGATAYTAARIGFELGPEMAMRWSTGAFLALRRRLGGDRIADATPLLWRLRMIKSAAELEKIAKACRIASDAFAAVPERIAAGCKEREAAATFRDLLFGAGADQVPFIAAASGAAGYLQIVAGPSDRHLTRGDILFLDTGVVHDGYFCDFDRNFAVGAPEVAVERAYDALLRATDAAINALRPGLRAAEICAVIGRSLEDAGYAVSATGRMGHGFGLQLTEPPSLALQDATVLEAGMALTIEPAITLGGGRLLVHEENVSLQADGAQWLSTPAPRSLPRLR